MNIQARVQELGLILPPSPKPAGAYTPFVISGALIFISGQISKTADGILFTGRAGKELDLDGARRAAEAAALNSLSILNGAVEGGEAIRIVRLAGFVQTTHDFVDIPQVMDAASELFQKVFGSYGIHARTSVGVSSLPLNAAVEIEVTAERLPA